MPASARSGEKLVDLVVWALSEARPRRPSAPTPLGSERSHRSDWVKPFAACVAPQ